MMGRAVHWQAVKLMDQQEEKLCRTCTQVARMHDCQCTT